MTPPPPPPRRPAPFDLPPSTYARCSHLPRDSLYLSAKGSSSSILFSKAAFRLSHSGYWLLMWPRHDLHSRPPLLRAFCRCCLLGSTLACAMLGFGVDTHFRLQNLHRSLQAWRTTWCRASALKPQIAADIGLRRIGLRNKNPGLPVTVKTKRSVKSGPNSYHCFDGKLAHQLVQPA